MSIEIRDPSEMKRAFKVAADAGVRALLVPASGILVSQASQITELAATSRLPTIYEMRPFVDVGGSFLMVPISKTSGDARRPMSTRY